LQHKSFLCGLDTQLTLRFHLVGSLEVLLILLRPLGRFHLLIYASTHLLIIIVHNFDESSGDITSLFFFSNLIHALCHLCDLFLL